MINTKDITEKICLLIPGNEFEEAKKILLSNFGINIEDSTAPNQGLMRLVVVRGGNVGAFKESKYFDPKRNCFSKNN